MTLIDQPPAGDPGSGGVVDRYDVQHDVMVASRREAVRSEEERVRVIAEEAIVLGSQIAALQGRLAATLAELDAADGCAGHRSVASWAGWHLGLPAGEARRLGKVATALADRRLLAAACGEGTIPLAAAAMVADITTPENEAKVVALTKNATGPQISKICSDYRHATNDDTVDPPDPSVSVTKHRGGYRLGGWLPALGGDTFKQGLQAELDRLWDDHHTTNRDTTRDEPTDRPTRADAMVSLAERALAPDAVTTERAEKYLTMIHAGLDGEVTLTDDTPIDIEDFKTILRSSSFSWILSLRGIPLWTTHKIRTANRAMRRALRARDRCCAYPGCTNLGYLDAHHLTPYADNPETRLDGLVLLCWIHHHIVHDRGETLTRAPDGTMTVHRADGTTWTGKRPPRTTADPPDIPRHHRAYAGNQLTHYARDVILHHLLGNRPIPMETETEPADPGP